MINCIIFELVNKKYKFTLGFTFKRIFKIKLKDKNLLLNCHKHHTNDFNSQKALFFFLKCIFLICFKKILFVLLVESKYSSFELMNLN